MVLSPRWIGCAIWAMILLEAAGCKRSTATNHPPVPIWLGPVAIAPATGPQDHTSLLDRELLAQQARSQLGRSEVFAGETAEGSKPGAAVATFHINLAMAPIRVEGKSALRAVVRLVVSTRPQGVAPLHFGEDVQAQAEILVDAETHAEDKAVVQRLAERTVNDLLTTYIARQKLWSADSAALHAALISPNEIRVEAIRVATARKLTDEVPTLVSLLSDDDEEIRDAALGALVELRDRRAIPALTKTKSMKDRRELRKIIDALATLGGQEAADYLSFVADAHEDEEVRRIAKTALERLNAATRHP
jgi:hypothetical protein